MRKLSWLLILAAVLFAGGCKKEVEKSFPFTIRVETVQGVPVNNSHVTASADVPNAIPKFDGYTDVNGEVSFEYNNEAVLKVQATRGGTPPTWIGCGYIKLERGERVTKVIVIQPYDSSVGGC